MRHNSLPRASRNLPVPVVVAVFPKRYGLYYGRAIHMLDTRQIGDRAGNTQDRMTGSRRQALLLGLPEKRRAGIPSEQADAFHLLRAHVAICRNGPLGFLSRWITLPAQSFPVPPDLVGRTQAYRAFVLQVSAGTWITGMYQGESRRIHNGSVGADKGKCSLLPAVREGLAVRRIGIQKPRPERARHHEPSLLRRDARIYRRR